MIEVLFGYDCMDWFDCDKKGVCKYANHRFRSFEIPYLFSIYPRVVKLSGTNKCPYKKTRNYTCANCAHTITFEECDMPMNERKPYIPSGGWKEFSRCGSYEKAACADDCIYDEIYVVNKGSEK